MSEILEYKLYDVDGDDNVDELTYKGILEDLLTQRSSPAQAAKAMDTWVIDVATRRYEQLKRRDPPFELTAKEKEENEWAGNLGPNPSQCIDMIIDSIASVCSAFPPERQENLIQFFRELKEIPKHEVLQGDYTTDWQNPTYDGKFTLWPFGTCDDGYLGERFRRQADDIAYPFSDVEVLGSKTQQRWRNFQAFVARLSVSNLIDCTRATALIYLLPDSPLYPDLKSRKVGGPRRLTADLIAATYWLDDAQARRWVYTQCMGINGTGENDDKHGWSRNNWSAWKGQFAFMAGDDRFSDETRRLAQSLLEKMEAEG